MINTPPTIGHIWRSGSIIKINVRAVALCVVWLLSTLLTGCAGSSGTQQALSGHLLVVGSTALQPLATKAAELFQKQHPQVKIEVQGGGSIYGLQAVTSAKSDIGNSDIYADPAIYPDPNVTDHIVCVVPFTMVAGPAVPLNSLTQQQIVDIFATGNIRNWQQLGGQDLMIVPVVRPPTSGTRATFRKYILGGRDENSDNAKLLKSDSSTTVRDAVAHTPGAVGYLALSVVDKSVRPLKIDGFEPSLTNIESGHYSFWSYEHMYTLGDSNPLASAFLDFMLTSTVQQMAQKMGYIPINNMKLTTTGSVASRTDRTSSSTVATRESEINLRGTY